MEANNQIERTKEPLQKTDPEENTILTPEPGNKALKVLGIATGAAIIFYLGLKVFSDLFPRPNDDSDDENSHDDPPICPFDGCGLPEYKVLYSGESVCKRGHKWRKKPE